MSTSRAAARPRWAFAATLGGFMFGFELAVISGALLFLRRSFDLSGFEQGALVSVVPLGAMLGGLLAGRVADAIGRRGALIGIAAVFIVASALAAGAPNYGVLLVARAVTGVAVGAVSSIAPLYLSEIATPDRRGRLVTLNQLMVTLGIVAAYGVGLAFSGSGEWRAMFAAGLLPAGLLLLGMLRAPETPVRQVQARRGVGVQALMRSAAAPALIVGVTLAVVQQFAGINAVIAFAPTIMQRTGLTASNSILYSIAIGVANVAATAVSIRMVDRRGRRPLLLASTAGTGASLILLGLTFEVSLGDWGSWLALACLLGYVASFAIGLGPIFWLLISEIFPPEFRAAGAGVATAVNWFSSFVVGLVFVPLAAGIGEGPTFWVFAAVCALGFAFARRYVPETKGRGLDEIQTDVRGRFGRRARGRAAPSH